MELKNYDGKPTNLLRREVIEKLKAHFAKDNIDVDEYEHRLMVATNTESTLELTSLLSDLPGIEDEPDKETEVGEWDYEINTGMVRKSQAMVNIFSGTTRKGVWNPPRYLDLINIFGGSDIDFRNARIPPSGVTVTVVAVFGGVDIIVPPGINVEVNGIGIFGGFDDKSTGEVYEGAPTIKVDGIALFGGASVKVKPSDRKGRNRRFFRRR